VILKNQMKIYMVGGAIRDRIMNRPVRDTDYVVIGTDEAGFLSVFPYAKPVGRKKAVYIINGNEYTLSRSPDIETDLESRDLTINALAEDENGLIIAHPKALDDIANLILRPVRQSNFIEDPLRVFRAARFHAVFPDFSVSDDLAAAMKNVSEKGLLDSISPERVGMEVMKAFAAPVPSRFLDLLVKTGCIKPWLRELENFHEIPAGPAPHHDNSLFDHTCEVMDRLAGNSLLVWMGFCHDLGKSLTDKKMLPHHYGMKRQG
jgi:tRNA nucleotidyltransferase (CCA-adding enzyme)